MYLSSQFVDQQASVNLARRDDNKFEFYFISIFLSIQICMSFFSKTEIGELKRNNEKIIRIAVSNVPINPTIAITTSNKIHLYNESGEKHQYELSRAITPTAIEWHPFNPVLAIGWDNGRITIWNEDTKAPKEEGKPHVDPIMMIRFNPSGSRMVTSDLTGTIGVWRGINLLAVYQKQWAITHCVFSELHLEGVKGNLGNLFLFAGRSGTVCLANDMNMCSDVCRVGGTIKALMFYQKQGSAIVITSNLLLVQFKINFTEKSVPEKKVKLSISGQPQNLSSIWIGQSLLSTCSNENMIRFWHLEKDENYNLTVFDVLMAEGNNSGVNLGIDKISSIAYDSRGRSLVAGTKEGRLMFWKNMALGTDSPVDKDQWSPQPYLNLGKQIQILTVGKNNGVIVCKQSDGEVIVVSETKITGRISGGYSILLKGSDTIEVKYESPREKLVQKYVTGSNIKGVDLNGEYLLYWNNKSIQILNIVKEDKLYIKTLSSIKEKPIKCMFAGRDTIIITTDFGLNQLNLNGQVKQSLTFPESEGKVVGIDILGNFLVVWTQSSYIRVFNISTDIRQAGQPRRFEDSKGLIGHIKNCSINSNGKKVGIVSNKATNSGSLVSHAFHIYDTDNDSFNGYEFGQQKIPVQIYWDKKEPRYFGVQAEVNKVTVVKAESNEEDEERDPDTDKESKEQQEEQTKGTTREFLTFFYTTETGIKYQDKYLLRSGIIDIFALKIPCFYSTERSKDEYFINKTTLHDYHKINTDDEIIKNSILNFSFYLTSGNLDEAYKSVKSIQSSAIWQKMAIMCVKSKRLDVAQICIGNMKFARGARSIRQAKKQPEIQSQLAMVALQLGMVEQAKALYEQSGRYDLLNKVFQANGQVEKAVEIAQKFDRINLKNNYYSTAKFYEAQGKYDQAIQYYQKSHTHLKQVPRMMYDAHKIDELIDYVEKKKEKPLYTWLGQYQESIGKTQEAIKYYELGESTSNLVRLYLSQNQLQESIRICNSESEPQACFLLARHMEKIGMLSEAIHFYAKAQYYSQAVKIAINNELDGEIVGLSMASPKQVAFRSAVYFQKKGLAEKAIRLYKKAGAIKKANTLAEQHGFTELISVDVVEEDSQDEEELMSGGDKGAITARVGQLIEAGKFDRAVPLLISIKQYDKALDLCIQHNVPIHDDLVKKMIPDQEPTNPMERNKRSELMKTLAEKCRKQGSFQTASNLYVKLGDKQRALKCLIELGDANQVITFANNARSNQTWILAANFLQTADWHQNPELMKNIISFYSKAKAFDNLAGFFQACSNVEIDEYRDYQKASAALKQAIKHLSKSTSPDREAKIANLNYKKNLIDKFLSFKDLAETDPKGMANECLKMLEEPDIQQSVRRGDIFAIVIEYHFEMQEYDKCFQYLKMMKEKGIIITPYVDKQIIQTVYKQLGISSNKPKKGQIEEEVIQDIS